MNAFLIEEFVRQFEQAFEMMAGAKPSVRVDPAGQLPLEPLVWEQPFSIDGGYAWFTGASENWTGAGERLLAAAGIDDADAATAKSTVEEILSQTYSGLARTLSGRAGFEITAGTGAETTALPATDWQRLEVQSGESSPLEFFLSFSSAMRQNLGQEQASPQITTAMTGPGRSADVSLAENSKTLDLLLDVELPVSVSFGRAQLPLKDVIKLTTGSIVELNRTVGEPVEVIVNNCVIARGEVVVVEGNFGVRIQQVISKQERLRTLY